MRYTSVHIGSGWRSRYSDSLRTGRSGDRILVGGRFSAPIQIDPGAHTASYTMGSGSFLGVKRPGHGIDHPTTYSAEVKEREQLYTYSPSGPSWPVLGWTLPLPLPQDEKSLIQIWQSMSWYFLITLYMHQIWWRLIQYHHVKFTPKAGHICPHME